MLQVWQKQFSLIVVVFFIKRILRELLIGVYTGSQRSHFLWRGGLSSNSLLSQPKNMYLCCSILFNFERDRSLEVLPWSSSIYFQTESRFVSQLTLELSSHRLRTRRQKSEFMVKFISYNFICEFFWIRVLNITKRRSSDKLVFSKNISHRFNSTKLVGLDRNRCALRAVKVAQRARIIRQLRL